MTSQNHSPAALRNAAIVFASICCTAAACGAAMPLLVPASSSSAFGMRSIMIGAMGTPQSSDKLRPGDANA